MHAARNAQHPVDGPMIALRNLTVTYGRHPALHHINCDFARGSLTAIAGPNGAGKSTLLKSLMGLIPVESGEVVIGLPRARIAYLPQRAELDSAFPITVLDCVLLGYWQRCGLFRTMDRTLQTRAVEALQAVGLDGFARRSISTLSVGQFQRVLFARILVQDADLILLDEPFNAVDERTTADLLRLVHDWHAAGRTIVAVLHDLTQVQRHFPQTALLARKLVAYGPTHDTLTETNLQNARAMPEAWNDEASFCAPAPNAPLVMNEDGRPHVHVSGHPHTH